MFSLEIIPDLFLETLPIRSSNKSEHRLIYHRPYIDESPGHRREGRFCTRLANAESLQSQKHQTLKLRLERSRETPQSMGMLLELCCHAELSVQR